MSFILHHLFPKDIRSQRAEILNDYWSKDQHYLDKCSIQCGSITGAVFFLVPCRVLKLDNIPQGGWREA